MQNIERELTELETREHQLAQSLSSSSSPAPQFTAAALPSQSPYACKRLVIILREASIRALQKALDWLRSHGPACYDPTTGLTIVLPSAQPFKWAKESGSGLGIADPSQLPDYITDLLKHLKHSLLNQSICVFGFRPSELVRAAVELIRHPAPETGQVADLVVIGDCRIVGKAEYEAPEYKPLLEEVLLKEAVQPVILLK
jgi:hypothetical protein